MFLGAYMLTSEVFFDINQLTTEIVSIVLARVRSAICHRQDIAHWKAKEIGCFNIR